MLALVAMTMGIGQATAQDAVTKAKMAIIRKAYARALTLEANGKKGPKKNYQHMESVATDPNGVWTTHVDFIFDNSQQVKELDIYPLKLVMARQIVGEMVQEFLYDNDGNLIFVYIKSDPAGQDETTEYRYYYDKGIPFWKIEKDIDLTTNKVTNTTQRAVDPTEAGTEIWYTRPAADIKQAFEALNRVYD